MMISLKKYYELEQTLKDCLYLAHPDISSHWLIIGRKCFVTGIVEHLVGEESHKDFKEYYNRESPGYIPYIMQEMYEAGREAINEIILHDVWEVVDAFGMRDYYTSRDFEKTEMWRLLNTSLLNIIEIPHG